MTRVGGLITVRVTRVVAASVTAAAHSARHTAALVRLGRPLMGARRWAAGCGHYITSTWSHTTNVTL